MPRAACPYKVIGGTRFYDRREVKDALAYLKAVVNPADEVSREAGHQRAQAGRRRHHRRASSTPGPGRTACRSSTRCDAPTRPGVTGRARRAASQTLRRRCSTSSPPSWPTVRPADAARGRPGARRATSPSSRPSTRSRPTAASRTWPSWWASAHEFETVDEFLEQVSLVADTDQLPDDDELDDSKVVLMTLHSAKGLEFPVVFLIGMEDGVFPHLRSLGEPDELEEERRLAYVGITRARERLLPHPRLEPHALRLHQYNPPSRFLDEIPERARHRGRGQPARIAWRHLVRLRPRLVGRLLPERLHGRPAPWSAPASGGSSTRLRPRGPRRAGPRRSACASATT